MKAFTLLELIVVLVIISIISVLVIPYYQHFTTTQYADLAIRQLNRAINFARSYAIYQSQLVTLHPHKQWRFGYSVSVDGKVIKNFKGLSHGATMIWQGFPNHAYLQFTPQGFTNCQNGSFSYIDANGKVIEKLIINQAARTRIEKNLDNQHHETA